jgi:hypothetical protein
MAIQPKIDSLAAAISRRQEEYGFHGEHPDYPRLDWQYEAGNGDTQLGYWEWVIHQEESNPADADR